MSSAVYNESVFTSHYGLQVLVMSKDINNHCSAWGLRVMTTALALLIIEYIIYYTIKYFCQYNTVGKLLHVSDHTPLWLHFG